jgi:hypothetical protein
MDDPVRGQLQPPRQRRRIWSSESRLPTRGPPCQVARLRGALDPSQERLCARMARVRTRQATPPQAAASSSSSSSAGPLPAEHAEPPNEAPRLVGWLPLQPVMGRPPRRPRQLGSEERPCGGEPARLHSPPGQRICGAGARCSMRAHRTAGRQRGPRNPDQASWPRGAMGSRHISQQAQRGLESSTPCLAWASLTDNAVRSRPPHGAGMVGGGGSLRAGAQPRKSFPNPSWSRLPAAVLVGRVEPQSPAYGWAVARARAVGWPRARCRGRPHLHYSLPAGC